MNRRRASTSRTSESCCKCCRLLSTTGNTVIVIEHNIDVIKTADYIIDMGPEGGEHGGEVMAVGTPEQVAKNKKSVTGSFIKTALK